MIWFPRITRVRCKVCISFDIPSIVYSSKRNLLVTESNIAVTDNIVESAPTMSTLVKSAKTTECGPICYTRAFWSKREASAKKFTPLLGNFVLAFLKSIHVLISLSILDDSPLKHEYQGAFEQWKSSQQSFDDTKKRLDMENNKVSILFFSCEMHVNVGYFSYWYFMKSLI